MSAFGTKRTSLVALHMSAFEGKADMTFAVQMSANDPERTFAKIGLRLRYVFGVRYHETLDFFRIMGALRCKANNFFGYDFN